MATLKNKELKSVNVEELKTRLEELKKDLIKLNVQKSTGTTAKNPKQIKDIKKTIARILTFVHGKSVRVKQEGKRKPSDKEKQEGGSGKIKNG